MDPNSKHNFPATHIVHWPTGPTPCCQAHADKLVALGNFLGSHIAVTPASSGQFCQNCINENKTN